MLDYYRSYAMPEIQEHTRPVNEARAAALYGSYRTLIEGVGTGLRVIGSLARRLQRRHRERVAIGQLSALDDRMLADIGLRRHDISATIAAVSRRSPAAFQELQARTHETGAKGESGRRPAEPFCREAANENSAEFEVLPSAA
jgi:uncharacterized protein YjiS (DUF1127 family)